MSTRVVLADDHTPMRETVAAILDANGFSVVGQAGDADGAVELVQQHAPDVCLLDINMPGDGIEAARRIAAAHPATTVVMLTVHVDDDHLFDAIRAGARGYLVKGTLPADLVASLNQVLAGEPALSPGMAMRILDQFTGREHRRVRVEGRGFVELSTREAEVLDLLRQGVATAVIARRLFISPTTVRSHIASTLKKLNASSRTEAVRLFGS